MIFRSGPLITSSTSTDSFNQIKNPVNQFVSAGIQMPADNKSSNQSLPNYTNLFDNKFVPIPQLPHLENKFTSQSPSTITTVPNSYQTVNMLAPQKQTTKSNGNINILSQQDILDFLK